MIKVSYKDTGKKRKLVVEGHGGLPKGQDIFCSAASALVIAVESTLSTSNVKHSSEIRDGFAEIKCNRPESKTVFYTAMNGFYTMATLYPDHFEVVS